MMRQPSWVVACPECSALQGEPCRNTRTGRPWAADTHWKRRELAARRRKKLAAIGRRLMARFQTELSNGLPRDAQPSESKPDRQIEVKHQGFTGGVQ